jgi:hypothetical protein
MIDRLRFAHAFVDLLIGQGYDPAWSFYCVALLLQRDIDRGDA